MYGSMLGAEDGELSEVGFIVFFGACEEPELWDGVGGSGRLVWV